VRLTAAVSSSLRSALAGPARVATWLGATPAALYVQITSEPGVLALVAHDAVRLPCSLVLPTTTAELPLTWLALPRVAAAAGPLVGDGVLAWTGPAGPVIVRAVREWAPPTVRGGTVAARALAAARGALPRPAVAGIDDRCLRLLTADPPAAVARLLGLGPGLTPAGDDVLAGFLVGAAAFGLDATGIRAAITALGPARTTALSAALLWHAARGECIGELAAVAAVLTSQSDGGITGHQELEPALARLLAIGHTSGPALAAGLATAATAASNPTRRRANHALPSSAPAAGEAA
jgi:hypothetical protein